MIVEFLFRHWFIPKIFCFSFLKFWILVTVKFLKVFEDAEIWQRFKGNIKADEQCLRAKSQNSNLTSMTLNLSFLIIFRYSYENFQ